MGFLDLLLGKRSSHRKPRIRKTVIVAPGDTLMSIANREYGDESKWELIFEANRHRFDGMDPTVLELGMMLDIPEIED